MDTVRFDISRFAVSDEALANGVLGPAQRSVKAWLAHAEQAFAERHREEGFAALARAVGRGADPNLLRAALLQHTLPTDPIDARRLALSVLSKSSPRILLGALVAGADPVMILRRISMLLPTSVAVDFLEAAITLADDPLPLLFARGMMRLIDGNIAGARQDERTLRHRRRPEAAILAQAIATLNDESLKVA